LARIDLQLEIDRESSRTTVCIAGMNLFQDDRLTVNVMKKIGCHICLITNLRSCSPVQVLLSLVFTKCQMYHNFIIFTRNNWK
jgi:hypothetical protein